MTPEGFCDCPSAEVERLDEPGTLNGHPYWHWCVLCKRPVSVGEGV